MHEIQIIRPYADIYYSVDYYNRSGIIIVHFAKGERPFFAAMSGIERQNMRIIGIWISDAEEQPGSHVYNAIDDLRRGAYFTARIVLPELLAIAYTYRVDVSID